MIRLAVILTLLTAITAGAWTQEMLMGAAYARRGAETPSEAPATQAAYLKCWLRFNSGSGDYQPDYSGQNNYATQAVSSARGSISNSAIYLDGSDDIYTANTSLINGATQFVATAWINHSAHGNYASIWAACNSAGTESTGIQADLVASKKVYGAFDAAGYALSANSYSNDIWCFTAAYGIRGLKAGVCVSNTLTEVTISLGSCVVTTNWNAGKFYNNSQRVTGFIDDCRVYDFSAMSDFRAQVTNIINQIRAEGRR